MVDAKIEGYLVAAMALIPAGVGMITAAPDTGTRLIGLGMVALGIVAVYLRGLQKDKVTEG